MTDIINLNIYKPLFALVGAQPEHIWPLFPLDFPNDLDPYRYLGLAITVYTHRI